jgi:hypothetical protein
MRFPQNHSGSATDSPSELSEPRCERFFRGMRRPFSKLQSHPASPGGRSVAADAGLEVWPPASRTTVGNKLGLRACSAHGPEVQTDSNELGSQCRWIFEVDYSINSKKPRFFIYNVDTGAFYMYECAHGTVLRNCNKSACSGGRISSRAGRRRWRNDARGTTWPNGSETAI